MGVPLICPLISLKGKEEYQDAGVDYYQPWMVLMQMVPQPMKFHTANRCADLINNRKLTVFQ